MAGNNQLVGLRRGLKVIEVLAGEPDGMLFGGLRDAFPDLAPSTISRLLKVLADEGMVGYDASAKRYVLAGRAVRLADAVRGQVPVARRVQPVLDRLAADTGLSAVFMEMRAGATMITAKAEVPEAFHYGPVGASPVSNTHAVRQVCCVHLGAAERQALRAPFKARKTSLAELRRLDVFVNTDDDQPGLTRIAAPVYGADGTFAGALGVSFFQRFPEKRVREIAERVKDAAQTALS